MKKKFVLALMLLMSISMILSSFAHASELQTSMQNELMKQNEKDLADVKALLVEATDEDSRDLLQARLWDLQQEHEELGTQLD